MWHVKQSADTSVDVTCPSCRRFVNNKTAQVSFRGGFWRYFTVSHCSVSSFSFCTGSTFCAKPSPSLEYAFVFVSRSTTLKRSICFNEKHNSGMIIHLNVCLFVSFSKSDCSQYTEWSLLTVSMSFRFSTSCLLSLISLDATHDLIWSRSLCEGDDRGHNEHYTPWFGPKSHTHLVP